MNRGIQGYHHPINRGGEDFKMYVPRALPPAPPLEIDTDLWDGIEQANRALGRLDGAVGEFPERSLFLYLYIRKEAVLSSQIEGTQSSLSDLLFHESRQAPGVPLDDVIEVSRYVAAMDYGNRKLREGAPLTLRLIREIHNVLLSEGRGSDKLPGEFRRTPVWIGGDRPGTALFVAAPPESVIQCMGDLEDFIHDIPKRTPVLVKAALAHVQFETIHPFLDENGRVGRLLITFLLCAENAVAEPLLYLSLYFKKNRAEYYDLLQRIRMDGDWEAWLSFFLKGVIETSESAADTSRRIRRLFDTDRKRIENLGRTAGTGIRVHHVMCKRVLATISQIVDETGLSHPTVATSLKQLESLGLSREITGRRKDRLFLYPEYLSILNEGTEPLAR